MSLVVVDIESDGPCPEIYSMVCFGAVVVDTNLDNTFYGETSPIGSKYVSEALAVSGFSRTEHAAFDHPSETMPKFFEWVNRIDRPVFISDNNGFDWQWINYYFHRFCPGNPFGFSSRRISDVYSGLVGDMGKGTEWKKFRKTKHTHNPVDDAMGNAQALLKISEMGVKGII